MSRFNCGGVCGPARGVVFAADGDLPGHRMFAIPVVFDVNVLARLQIARRHGLRFSGEMLPLLKQCVLIPREDVRRVGVRILDGESAGGCINAFDLAALVRGGFGLRALTRRPHEASRAQRCQDQFCQLNPLFHNVPFFCRRDFEAKLNLTSRHRAIGTSPGDERFSEDF